jgi:hypothetical protein
MGEFPDFADIVKAELEFYNNLLIRPQFYAPEIVRLTLHTVNKSQIPEDTRLESLENDIRDIKKVLGSIADHLSVKTINL